MSELVYMVELAGGDLEGPLTAEMVHKLIRGGSILPDARVSEGDGPLLPIYQHAAFAAAFGVPEDTGLASSSQVGSGGLVSASQMSGVVSEALGRTSGFFQVKSSRRASADPLSLPASFNIDDESDASTRKETRLAQLRNRLKARQSGKANTPAGPGIPSADDTVAPRPAVEAGPHAEAPTDPVPVKKGLAKLARLKKQLGQRAKEERDTPPVEPDLERVAEVPSSTTVEFLDPDDVDSDPDVEAVAAPVPPAAMPSEPEAPSTEPSVELTPDSSEDSEPALARVEVDQFGNAILAQQDLDLAQLNEDGQYRVVIQGLGDGFPDSIILMDPTELRERLLELSMSEILGVTLDDDIETVLREYITRIDQMRVHPDVLSDDEPMQAALADILTILQIARTVLVDAFYREMYIERSEEEGRELFFLEFAEFEISESLPPALINAAEGTEKYNAALIQSRANLVARSLSRVRAKKLAEEEEAQEPKRMSREEQEAAFEGVEAHEWGEAFGGKLFWSAKDGKPTRGLLHVLPMFVAAFFVCFGLVTLGDLGTDEFKVAYTEPMIYARFGVLSVLAFIGIVAIRREKPSRIGLLPEFVSAFLALPIVAVLGGVALVIAKLEISADANFFVILGLLGLRAAGETLFFYGFVGRTLLIEFDQPILPLVLTTIMYGIYSLSYADLIAGSPLEVMFGAAVYALGVGLPFLLIYYKSRSVPFVWLCMMIVFGLAAYGGWSRASLYAN